MKSSGACILLRVAFRFWAPFAFRFDAQKDVFERVCESWCAELAAPMPSVESSRRRASPRAREVPITQELFLAEHCARCFTDCAKSNCHTILFGVCALEAWSTMALAASDPASPGADPASMPGTHITARREAFWHGPFGHDGAGEVQPQP